MTRKSVREQNAWRRLSHARWEQPRSAAWGYIAATVWVVGATYAASLWIVP